ncbi:glycoside hydrolase family 9 protein [Nibricoccus sp. IMCC34717]|uniref:glycoside hydrolase family 9 protein n=1 Tax=Nibricoccus sp. IMCC34717 TaxID=3034021 RepID=UPI003850B051
MTPPHRLPASAISAAFLLFAASALPASQLLEVTPIRADLLALHVLDGTVDYAKSGQSADADVLTISPLKTDALGVSAFTLTSTDDSGYAGGKNPSSFGRKTKGAQFARFHDNYTAPFGFKPTRPYAALEHWVYLKLPTALVEGKSYTLSWNATTLALDGGSKAFQFKATDSRSESIHVNVVGYDVASPAKYGYIYHWAGDLGGQDFASLDGKPFNLVDATSGATVYSGTIAFRKAANNQETGQALTTPGDNFLGSAVWECNFSSFTTPGTYRLSVPGLGCSYPFPLQADAYRQAFSAAMKGLYNNRSGIALETPYTKIPRPAPHNVKLTPGFAGRLKYTTTRFFDTDAEVPSDSAKAAQAKAKWEAGAKGALTDTWGWYQDAGDWDGYFTHINIPNYLLALYQLYPTKFSDGELNIPESTNGIPDLVDEGAWLPRFFQRLRAELKAKGWGTGGVGSRVFGDFWGEDTPNAIVRGSWQDTTRDWYVTGEDAFSTYRYAACAAQLAEIFEALGKPDPAGVNWRTEATESYAWAAANTKPGDEALNEGGEPLRIHRALAAVALFRLTGEASYHTTFKADTSSLAAPTNASLSDIEALAATLYLTHPDPTKLDSATATRLRDAVKASALFLTDYSASRRACRYGGHWYFPMVIGQGSTPLIHSAVLGYAAIKPSDPSAAATIESVAYTTADYFLGVNPLHMTWITGLGIRNPEIFHMDDFATGLGHREGRIPYGPVTFGEAWVTGRMVFSPYWAWDTTFPSIDPRGPFQPASTAQKPGTWPGHEAWFNLRGSPQMAEYTVWQNNATAAVSYGFLTAEASTGGIAITTQPASVTTTEGQTIELSVASDAGVGATYQWYRNGIALTGATTASLKLPVIQTYQAGNYTVSIRRGASSVLSDPAVVTVNTSSRQGRLIGISSRGYCRDTNSLMIAGFVVSGGAERNLVARVIGPGLLPFGVTRYLPKPRLELHNYIGGGNWLKVAENTDWTEGGAEFMNQRFAAVGTFVLKPGVLDTAIARTSSAGNYTVTAQLGDGKPGNALIEIYDGDSTAPGAELSSLSTRGYTGTGEDLLIAGFAINTSDACRLLVRGMGPSLAAFGVGDVLQDPVLELYDGQSKLLLRADNWRDAGNAADITTTSSSVGAFYPSPDNREAVLLVSLPGGAYTAILRGANGGTGNSLIELYRVP